MSLSMFQVSVPVLARSLANLDHILDVGAAHVAERRLDPAVVLAWRLAPDMFPLTRQVQIATDMAKGCVSRLAGRTPPAYADDEASFDELKARVAKTLAHVQSFDAAAIDGSESRTVTLKVGGADTTFGGFDYLFFFVLPNVHFHVTTAYDILRHIGAPLGKQDFMGQR